jgi:nitrile hydratase accessory protein
LSDCDPWADAERIAVLQHLPLDDGEPVFAEPWEAQAFALAVQLSKQGYFTWKEWAAALADELKAAADRGEPDDGSQYYHHWLAALERLVTEKQLTSRHALAARREAWAEAYRHTPHGKPVVLDPSDVGLGRALVFTQQVVLGDGRVVDVVQRRGHLSYCYASCCCGRVDRGYLPVPVDAYKGEWLGRRLRKIVHLTKGGCLGPCSLANVASLTFDGRAVWFHSVDSPDRVAMIFDYIEAMIAADRYLHTPPALAPFTFNFYDWDARGPEPLRGDRL